jgi:hypothetical protein
VLAEASTGALPVKGRHLPPHGPTRIASALRRDPAVDPAVTAVAAEVSVPALHGAPRLVAGPCTVVARRIDMRQVAVVARRILTLHVHTVTGGISMGNVDMVPRGIIRQNSRIP